MDTPFPLSTTQDQQTNEVTAYHETGHAVMARLFGRRVHDIEFVVNVQGTYNGRTHWGRDEIICEWDHNIPYTKLGLRQEEAINAIALIIAAGKAAERLWYRKRSLGEFQASYGSKSAFDDEQEIEDELMTAYPSLKPEQLPQAKQITEELAMRLLETEICWQAIEVVARTLIERLALAQGRFLLKDIQQRISDAFLQTSKGT